VVVVVEVLVVVLVLVLVEVVVVELVFVVVVEAEVVEVGSEEVLVGSEGGAATGSSQPMMSATTNTGSNTANRTPATIRTCIRRGVMSAPSGPDYAQRTQRALSPWGVSGLREAWDRKGRSLGRDCRVCHSAGRRPDVLLGLRVLGHASMSSGDDKLRRRVFARPARWSRWGSVTVP